MYITIIHQLLGDANLILKDACFACLCVYLLCELYILVIKAVQQLFYPTTLNELSGYFWTGSNASDKSISTPAVEVRKATSKEKFEATCCNRYQHYFICLHRLIFCNKIRYKETNYIICLQDKIFQFQFVIR